MGSVVNAVQQDVEEPIELVSASKAKLLPRGSVPGMEAFETFVALALETEGLVVSEAVKFRMARQTTSGFHEHGYEVDLLGARRDRLVLASVKSYFGSKGVHADHVAGTSKDTTYNKRYALLNDLAVRNHVMNAASERYGYKLGQVELRLLRRQVRGPTRHSRHPCEGVVRQPAGRQRIYQGDRSRRRRPESPRGRRRDAVSRQRRACGAQGLGRGGRTQALSTTGAANRWRGGPRASRRLPRRTPR